MPPTPCGEEAPDQARRLLRLLWRPGCRLVALARHFLGEYFEASDEPVALRGGKSVEGPLELGGAVAEADVYGAFLAFGDRDDRATAVGRVLVPLDQPGCLEFDRDQAGGLERYVVAGGKLGDGQRSVERYGQQRAGVSRAETVCADRVAQREACGRLASAARGHLAVQRLRAAHERGELEDR